MTPEQIVLIRRSFPVLADKPVASTRAFHDRLFALAPEIRPLFKSDLRSQALKFIDTVELCVGQLDHGPFLHMTLEGLGQRHAAYGVGIHHHGPVREALLRTLEDCLGPEGTPEVIAAWAAFYDRAAATMKAACPGIAAVGGGPDPARPRSDLCRSTPGPARAPVQSDPNKDL